MLIKNKAILNFNEIKASKSTPTPNGHSVFVLFTFGMAKIYILEYLINIIQKNVKFILQNLYYSKKRASTPTKITKILIFSQFITQQ